MLFIGEPAAIYTGYIPLCHRLRLKSPNIITVPRHMPYYVFRVTQPTPIIKNLQLQDSFDEYKAARALARELRAAASPGEQAIYKLVFAASQLEAEENLQEKREQPILMEWEK